MVLLFRLVGSAGAGGGGARWLLGRQLGRGTKRQLFQSSSGSAAK